jgi:death-on-curing protein
MEVFLVLNGFEIEADVDEQERVVLAVASSTMSRDELTVWLRAHLAPVPRACITTACF